jgi:epoxyqueuosine reductase
MMMPCARDGPVLVRDIQLSVPQQIRVWAEQLGFDDVGFADVDSEHVRANHQHIEDAVQQGRLEPLSWYASTLPDRFDVRRRLASAQSVVVVVSNYYTGDHSDHSDQAAPKVARYAWGADYHNVLRKRLRKLRVAMLTLRPDAKIAPFLDSEAVLERAWAHAAGLGFIGKSSMFIHPRFGTWTFLGGLLTNFTLPTSTPVTERCGTCTACLDACPTQAITAPFQVDARRCITTWTIENAHDPQGSIAANTGWAAGCDICQEVCPWNKFEQRTHNAQYQPRHVFLNADDPPTDVTGSPLARPGVEVLGMLANRAGSGSLGRQRRLVKARNTDS